MKGQSAEDNAAAALLRQWLDEAGMRMDDIRDKLTPEHFTDGRIPSRSALSERLAGLALRQDFIEAIADICSPNDVRRRQRLAEVQATRLQARTEKNEESAPPDTQLVLVQQRSIEVSDRLLRALERQQQLERERNDANQMVLILLSMVDKLQRDITNLARERDRRRVSDPARADPTQVYERLARTEQQRDTAETELARAKAERQKADQLAEEAAEQVRALTEELERLRGATSGAAASEPPFAAPVMQEPMNAGSDDIDLALSKAARHLDDRADRLDQLASELRLDNSVDNPLTSHDVADILPDKPVPPTLTPEEAVAGIRNYAASDNPVRDDVTLQSLLSRMAHQLSFPDVLQTAALLRREKLGDPAFEFVSQKVLSSPLADTASAIAEMSRKRRFADSRMIAERVVLLRSAADIADVALPLLTDDPDAGLHVLETAGERCSPVELLKLLARLDKRMANRVLHVACTKRPMAELPPIEAALRNLRRADAEKVAMAYRLRQIQEADPANPASITSVILGSDQIIPGNVTMCPYCTREIHLSKAPLLMGYVQCPNCGTILGDTGNPVAD
ncbi:hypothetical protein [Streptomyces sp. BK79]|uniref:hypothetical protein n=1 Tax=Streptomyces sp. BK79 TaxID=3350097 RepID=UPI0037706677